MRYILVDESGRLYDPSDRLLVFTGVVASNLIGLDRIIPQVRKTIPRKGKRKKEKTLAEIKFYSAGDKTRLKALELISKCPLKVFVLVIDKEGRKITDNPQNYSLLVSSLLTPAFKKHPDIKHVIIDRHFTYVTQRERFNQLLLRHLGKEVFVEHLDSQQNTIVSLPDFIAGAIRIAYTKGDVRFKEIIDSLIVWEKKITWRKLKKQKR